MTKEKSFITLTPGAEVLQRVRPLPRPGAGVGDGCGGLADFRRELLQILTLLLHQITPKANEKEMLIISAATYFQQYCEEDIISTGYIFDKTYFHQDIFLTRHNFNRTYFEQGIFLTRFFRQDIFLMKYILKTFF